MIAFVAMAGSLIALLLSRPRLAPPPLSPPWIFVGGMFATGALGWAFWDNVQYASAGASIQLTLTEELRDDTLALFAGFGAAVTAGALLVAWITPPVAALSERLTRPPSLTPAIRNALLVGAALPLTLVIGADPGSLISRTGYLRNSAAGLSSFGAQLAAVAVLAAGFLIATEKGGRRLFAVTLLVGYVLATFALGTRTFAMTPLLAAVGFYAGRRGSWWYLVPSAAAAIWLLQVPLYMRGLPLHGLGPYWPQIDDALTSGSPATAVKNLLVAFPISGYTAYVEPTIPPERLWIELNPLPGGVAGWYEIANFQRLNDFTPYSAVGTLGNAGWSWVVSVGLGLGMLLGHFDRRVRVLAAGDRTVFAFALLGLVVLATAMSAQYNLRSSARVVLYALILDQAIRFVIRGRSRSIKPPRG